MEHRLLDSLCERIDHLFAQAHAVDAHMTPPSQPRSSGLNWCAREMYNAIVHGETRPPFSEDQVARMERGRMIEERILIPQLLALGVQVNRSQMACEIKDERGRLLLRGHIDGLIDWLGVSVVFEAKTMVPVLWNQINSIHDLLESRWFYRYVLQILTYMFATGRSLGLLYLDDCLGHRKLLPIRMADWADLMGSVLARCAVVVDAVEAKEPPPFYHDPAHCRRCWCFEAGVCAPPMDAEGAGGLRIIASQELEEAISVMELHEEAKREYDRANKAFGAEAKARPDGTYIVGPFIVTISRSQRKGYTVPAGEVVRKKAERFLSLASDQPSGETGEAKAG